MKKWALIAIGGVFAVFLVVRIAGLLRGDAGREWQGGRPPVAVEVDSVRYGPIREIRRFTGTVYPENRYIIAPKVAGRLLQLRKRIGDPVARGELIALIDDAEYLQAVREAEASLRIADASLDEARGQADLARQARERIEPLMAKDLVTAQEYDAAITGYESARSRLALARAQVEQRQAALASARIRLGYTRLAASRAGLVGERFVDEGALLAPNSPVVLVVGIDSVIVRTTVTERDYGYIEPGQQVDVLVDAFPGRRFHGLVARVAPIMQEASRMAEMEVEVDNAAHMLKPGMFARVEVMTASRDSAQIVPGRAVVAREGRPAVFVVPHGAAAVRLVPVTTGIEAAQETEIVQPRLEGLVVTLGQHLLDDGSPVLLPAAPQGAPAATSDSAKGEIAR